MFCQPVEKSCFKRNKSVTSKSCINPGNFNSVIDKNDRGDSITNCRKATYSKMYESYNINAEVPKDFVPKIVKREIG